MGNLSAPAADDVAAVVRDLDVGRARARAAMLVTLALPGSTYLYQGQELALHEVLGLPPESRQDPVFFRTNGLALGRDGCRVPIPWSGDRPSYGFGPGEASWLPQPPEWAALSVESQRSRAGSAYELTRAAVALRRREPALGDGVLEWDDDHGCGGRVLVFVRPSRDGGGALRCAINMGDEPVTLPAGYGTRVLVCSGPHPDVVDGGVVLSPDTAVWLPA
jgi:alpha-glucosidase